MHKPNLMRSGEGGEKLDGAMCRAKQMLVDGQAGRMGEERTQRTGGQDLHDEVAPLPVQGIQRDKAGMLQVGEAAQGMKRILGRAVLGAGAIGWRGGGQVGERTMKELERNGMGQGGVLGQVHGPRRTATQLAQELKSSGYAERGQRRGKGNGK